MKRKYVISNFAIYLVIVFKRDSDVKFCDARHFLATKNLNVEKVSTVCCQDIYLQCTIE